MRLPGSDTWPHINGDYDDWLAKLHKHIFFTGTF